MTRVRVRRRRRRAPRPASSRLAPVLLLCLAAAAALLAPVSSAAAGAGGIGGGVGGGLWRATAAASRRRWSPVSIAASSSTTTPAPDHPTKSKTKKLEPVRGGGGGGGLLGWLRRTPPALIAPSPSACGEKPAPRLAPQWSRLLFLASCVNPIVAVLLNDYHAAPWPLVILDKEHPAAFRIIYKGVFSFLRLKPRLLFVVGSCLRALQCSTSLSRLIDPSVGVGLGLNLAALVCYARWPAPLVLGWAASKWFWTFLGAEPPRGGHVPITVHLSDPKLKLKVAEQATTRMPYFFGLF